MTDRRRNRCQTLQHETPLLTLDEAALCVGDLQEMLRWAYSKLRHVSYSKPADALMLDRMKLLLEHGIVAQRKANRGRP